MKQKLKMKGLKRRLKNVQPLREAKVGGHDCFQEKKIRTPWENILFGVWSRKWNNIHVEQLLLESKKVIRDYSVQFSYSVVSATPRIAAHQASLSITNSGVPSDSCPSCSDAIQPSHPRSSPSPPAPNPSQHQSLLQ